MRAPSVRCQFSHFTAKLEELHAISVEGQCDENSPDMQQVLCVHLRAGLVALDGALQEVANSLGGCQS